MAGVSIALEHAGDQDVFEPWVTPDQLSNVDADSVDLDSVCMVASEILFMLSGRQFGVREKLVRPTSSVDGWCGRSERELVLPGPIREIIELRLNGQVLTEAQYMVVDRRRVLRVPNGLWPFGQNLAKPTTENGTFSVHFKWGKDVPEGGKAAAKLFAQQLALYMAGKKCSLSDKLSTVTRQGTTRTYLDPSEFTRLSRTGLYLVDSWLSAVNPSGARRRPRVLSPDEPRKSRPT